MSYFDDNEDRIIYGANPGLRRRIVAAEERNNAVCKRCGAHPLKLCLNDNGKWQLMEQARGEHNRNVPHVCPVIDDFEDIS